MTITLTGLITCLEGQFRVKREVPDYCRFVAGEKIDFDNGLVLRVEQVTWHAGILDESFEICGATVQIDDFRSREMTREDSEILFQANGFEILPAREGE